MSEKTYNVAIVGATGAVGEALLSVLQERQFPINTLHLLASERSAGDALMYGHKRIIVENLATFDFKNVQIAFFAAGSSVSEQYIPLATAAGCVVIDKSSLFRYDSDVPLVVPEVNAASMSLYTKRRIIANPNCSTIPIAMALKPIYDAVGISRVNVATYQSVSGTGKDAIEELAKQTAALLNGTPIEKPAVYAKQIAFNVLPQIDSFEDNGYTKEEMKVVWEIQKILGDDAIQVNTTAVRVPVFYGHSAAVHLETKRKISAEEVLRLLSDAPGVKVLDERKSGGYPTAVTEASGNDWVYVGRIREDISHPTGINLWVVSDNIRKGAATNGVQIAELLVEEHL